MICYMQANKYSCEIVFENPKRCDQRQECLETFILKYYILYCHFSMLSKYVRGTVSTVYEQQNTLKKFGVHIHWVSVVDQQVHLVEVQQVQVLVGPNCGRSLLDIMPL